MEKTSVNATVPCSLLSVRRKPRADVAKKLTALLSRLVPGKHYSVRWIDAASNRRLDAEFVVVRVFVFGSFARGAPTCGDLDLIVEIGRVGESILPQESSAKRAVLGVTQGVDAFMRPDIVTFLKQFPEAIEVWSVDNPRGADRVAAIPIDVDAKRFERKTDTLPVALKRIRVDRAGAEALVDAIDAGMLTSEWVDADNIVVDERSWPLALQEEAQWLRLTMGESTAPCLPPALQFVSSQAHHDMTKQHVLSRGSAFNFGGYHVHVGRPSIDVHDLDSIARVALVLGPRASRAGRNGLWILRRGPTHAVSLAARDVVAWAHRSMSDGAISVVHKSSDEHPESVPTLELFSSEGRARDALRSWDAEQEYEVVQLEGDALLAAIACAREVDVNDGEDAVLEVAGDGVAFLEVLSRALAQPFSFPRGGDDEEREVT